MLHMRGRLYFLPLARLIIPGGSTTVSKWQIDEASVGADRNVQVWMEGCEDLSQIAIKKKQTTHRRTTV